MSPVGGAHIVMYRIGLNRNVYKYVLLVAVVVASLGGAHRGVVCTIFGTGTVIIFFCDMLWEIIIPRTCADGVRQFFLYVGMRGGKLRSGAALSENNAHVCDFFSQESPGWESRTDTKCLTLRHIMPYD